MIVRGDARVEPSGRELGGGGQREEGGVAEHDVVMAWFFGAIVSLAWHSPAWQCATIDPTEEEAASGEDSFWKRSRSRKQRAEVDYLYRSASMATRAISRSNARSSDPIDVKTDKSTCLFEKARRSI